MRLRTILSAAALAAVSAAGAQTVELNVISKVQVQDAGNEVVVSITGSKPPNFTTFSMMDPPRFVIDVSESTFKNVPEDLTGGPGLIQIVKNLSYGSEATSIARVMIAFTREVDPPDVQTAGTELVVRIAKPGDMGVAQRAPPAQPRAAPEAVAAAPAAAAEAAPAAAAAAAPAAAAPAAAAAAAPAAVPAAAAATALAEQARLEAEEQMRYEAKKKAEAEAQAKAEAEAERRAQAELEAKAKAEAAAAAAAQAQVDKALAAQEAKARAEAEAQAKADARAAADEEKRLKAEEAKARREAEAQAKVEAKAAAAEERRLKAEEARARREAEAQAKAEAKARAAEEAKARREAAALKVASVPPSQPRVEALAPSGAPNQVREVGFQQLPGASRVYVRTAQEPRFTIMEAGEKTIRVELANTRVRRRNDTRFMDTSFFASAVALVTPKREGSNYVVEIKLKERVPYQQKVEGDMLAIDFERPAGLSAPAGQPAPGEAAPGEPAGEPAPGEPAPGERGESPPPGGN